MDATGWPSFDLTNFFILESIDPRSFRGLKRLWTLGCRAGANQFNHSQSVKNSLVQQLTSNLSGFPVDYATDNMIDRSLCRRCFPFPSLPCFAWEQWERVVDDKPGNNMMLNFNLTSEFETLLHVKHFDLKLQTACKLFRAYQNIWGRSTF